MEMFGDFEIIAVWSLEMFGVVPLPRLGQLLDDPLPCQHPRAEFPAILVRVQRLLVAELECVVSLLPQVNIFVHPRLKPLGALDPIALNGVWQASKDIELVLQAPRYYLVDPFVLGVVINKIQHVDFRADLAEALDSPETLFQTGWIPR